MQAFARRGFQLHTASVETRIAYTGFLILMLLGVATLAALSLGRMGFHPQAIAAYYRGSDDEMSFPKTFWQLMEVSHFHLFTMPVVLLVVAYSGALCDAVGPWAIRYLAGGFAYVLLLGWTLLAGGSLLIIALTLVAMWRPGLWPDALTATASPDEDNQG